MNISSSFAMREKIVKVLCALLNPFTSFCMIHSRWNGIIGLIATFKGTNYSGLPADERLLSSCWNCERAIHPDSLALSRVMTVNAVHFAMHACTPPLQWIRAKEAYKRQLELDVVCLARTERDRTMYAFELTRNLTHTYTYRSIDSKCLFSLSVVENVPVVNIRSRFVRRNK